MRIIINRADLIHSKGSIAKGALGKRAHKIHLHKCEEVDRYIARVLDYGKVAQNGKQEGGE